MPFTNRIRLPFYLSKDQFPMERNVFRKADGSSKVISVVVRNTKKGATDYIPKEWHQKLAIALAHDEVTIEGDQLSSGVVLDSEYEIEWQDFKDYPVAQAGFTIQVTPFNATNSNCVTCEEVSQLSLVDDEFTDPIQEDTQVEIPDVLANDSICCYPAVVSLSWWNTTYFLSATIDQVGNLVMQSKPSLPDLTNVLVATYRVACADGTYDEADVYADLEGTAAGCNPPSNLASTALGDTTASFEWDNASPIPPLGYVWTLYDQADLTTPLQTGTTSVNTLDLTGLVPAYNYLLQVYSDCYASDSDPLNLEFTTTGTNETCSEFIISFDSGGEGGIWTYSYMDCNSVIQTEVISLGTFQQKCMLTEPGSTVPYFFSASTPEIYYTYNGICV